MTALETLMQALFDRWETGVPGLTTYARNLDSPLQEGEYDALVQRDLDPGTDERVEQAHATGMDRYTKFVAVELHVARESHDELAPAIHDLVGAVIETVTEDFTLGGRAIDVRVERNTPELGLRAGAAPIAMYEVGIVVDYATKEGKPNEIY